MKILIISAVALSFPVIIFWSLTQPAVEMTPEWELAIVNAGAQLPSDHPTVGEFRVLLARLEEKVSNSKPEIVEICITAYLWRKERGHLDTLLEFTNSIDDLAKDRRPGGQSTRDGDHRSGHAQPLVSRPDCQRGLL